MLDRYPAALVDADGDIAMTVDARLGWTIGISDPHEPDRDLITIDPDLVGPRSLGIATSGIDVHRWGDGPDRHHLIDPATRSPAVSDVEQCTVVAESAALAEAVAKAVVIRGSERGAALLARPGAMGGVLVLRSGQVLGAEEVTAWLV
jgi:thiamine biosynthesis lipoprotein